MLTYQPKITLADMRASSVRGVSIHCAYRCSHSIAISADRWPDDVCLKLKRPPPTEAAS
jgi:hypothetical protein